MVSIVSTVIVDVGNVEYSMFGWYKCTCIWGRFGDYFTILCDHAVVESSICEWKFSDVSVITSFCVHQEILITFISVLLYCGVKRLHSGPNHLSWTKFELFYLHWSCSPSTGRAAGQAYGMTSWRRSNYNAGKWIKLADASIQFLFLESEWIGKNKTQKACLNQWYRSLNLKSVSLTIILKYSRPCT